MSTATARAPLPMPANAGLYCQNCVFTVKITLVTDYCVVGPCDRCRHFARLAVIDPKVSKR